MMIQKDEDIEFTLRVRIYAEEREFPIFLRAQGLDLDIMARVDAVHNKICWNVEALMETFETIVQEEMRLRMANPDVAPVERLPYGEASRMAWLRNDLGMILMEQFNDVEMPNGKWWRFHYRYTNNDFVTSNIVVRRERPDLYSRTIVPEQYDHYPIKDRHNRTNTHFKMGNSNPEPLGKVPVNETDDIPEDDGSN